MHKGKLPPLRVRIAIIIVLLAIAAAWWYLESSKEAATAMAMASGTIEAEEVTIAAEVGGRVERVAVDEGDTVQKGDVLVELDKALLLAQLRQTQAAVEVARANLALVERGARPEDIKAAEGALAQAIAQRDAARKAWENARIIRESQQELNAQIDAARAQVEIARARLDQIDKGPMEADQAAAEAAVESARAALVQAQTAVEAEEKIATANLELAQAKLDALLAGPTPEQIREAEAALRVAKNQLYATQVQADAYLGSSLVWRGQAVYTKEMKEAQAAVAYEQVQAAEARLAQLTAPPRGELVRQAQAAVDQAEAQLAAKRRTRDEVVKAAAANLAAAEARLKKVQEGASEEERRIARATLAQAEQHLKNLEDMRENPLALNAQVDAAWGQYQAAEGAVQAAEARLEALKTGTTAEQLALAQAQVRQAEAAVSVIETQLAKMTLRAPKGGIISRRAVRPGETASPGTLLLTLADIDNVKLVVYVPETKVGLVRLGQSVDVSVDSFPGETFKGEVIYISPRAEFTPRNVQSARERASMVFAVKVRIPNPDHKLKPGMPADARLGL